tara:strand:+ start:11342 stop:11752 length:411 start_codon:yes stop_codon:yes gene_type:complete
MKIIKEFKEFAVKGNMIDMAIGIIIGASFNKVINVLVKNIFLPPLSLLSDGITLDKKKLIIRSEKINQTEVAIEYGLFLETLIDFLAIGITVFIVVKFFNSMKNKAHDVSNNEIKTPAEIKLLGEIKDILKNQYQK